VSARASTRYTTVAITLHWVIAIAILFQIATGLWMGGAIRDPDLRNAAFETFQLHKSIGLTVLVLSVARLGWRLAHPPPPMPPHMRPWERTLAHLVHGAFYGLMIAMPVTGWLYVSTGWSHSLQQLLSVETVYFGWLPIPHLSLIAEQEAAQRQILGERLISLHEAFAFTTLGLLAMHVGAVVKHFLEDGGQELARMAPFFKPRRGKDVL
jgi:cytochrome b561